LDLQAAEWVPSTITSVKKKQEDSDAIEDKLGSAFERIKKTVQVSAYSVCV
jgi:rubrerythrin